jgi:capsular polysaccharide biosynthesis protein
MLEAVKLLNTTTLLVGYHSAAFNNCVFLPRGAYILEILPQGTTNAPLYPTLAHRTGKEFVRCVLQLQHAS